MKDRFEFGGITWERYRTGLPRYARQYPMPNGKGRNLEAQMNAISLCTRPEVLHQITIK